MKEAAFMGCVPAWFGRALEWHSRGKGFDPPHLHQREVLAEKRVLLFCLFFCKKERGGSKEPRHRATVRWTVVTAADRGAQFAPRIDPPHLHQRKASAKAGAFLLHKKRRYGFARPKITTWDADALFS